MPGHVERYAKLTTTDDKLSSTGEFTSRGAPSRLGNRLRYPLNPADDRAILVTIHLANSHNHLIITPFFLVAWEFPGFNLLLRGQVTHRARPVHGMQLENSKRTNQREKSRQEDPDARTDEGNGRKLGRLRDEPKSQRTNRQRCLVGGGYR